MRNESRVADGVIRLDAEHQGRIFAELDGVMLHRWDADVAAHYAPVEFNNLGGNSLWPAPEGGKYAFNYLGGDWLVQPGVNTAPSELVGNMACRRSVTLYNNRGATLPMTFQRWVSPLDESSLAKQYQLKCTGYREEDIIAFDIPQRATDAVVAAWSLEQFQGAEGIVAFGKVAGNASRAVNRNFYGNPEPRLAFTENQFTFTLGGDERLQIGVSASQKPELIGAYIPERELVVIRSCEAGDGKRIDIADNEQPRGIYGADDQFSIFNGASLDFFELECIAPMTQDASGQVIGSSLYAETRFFQGAPEKLKLLLEEQYGVIL